MVNDTSALRDLRDRTAEAARKLEEMANDHSPSSPDHASRLFAKASGVRLVLGYIDEALSRQRTPASLHRSTHRTLR